MSSNAELSFRTRVMAEETPEALLASMRMDLTIATIMAADYVEADTARELSHDAAQRAGVTPGQLAEALLKVYRSPDER